ncbi:MAG: peptide ABC transporter substrate-binding protein, partial [Epsilonproteobacteria bacterium]|nr:peptide ABC transporter substrate-binding protein [Campylobacterota bacterium]
LIIEAERSVDKKRLSKLYKKIFRIIAKDKPYLFLYIPNSITAVNKRIKNVSSSIIGVMHNEIDWIKP